MTVNYELIERLHDHLVWLRDNNKAYKFDMASWISHKDLENVMAHTLDELRCYFFDKGMDATISATECGTVACLAGHVALLTGIDEHEDISRHAQQQLGLNDSQGSYMFGGQWSSDGLHAGIDSAISYLSRVVKKRRIVC